MSKTTTIEELEKRVKKLEDMVFEELNKPEKTYAVGQRFLNENDYDEEYILAQIGPREVALISLEDGNRWSVGVEVQSISSITKEEWEEISTSGGFEEVE